MQVENDVTKFIEDFDPVDNALQMRTLTRWNGRNLREKENLSEHTHLVIVCLYKILDEIRKYKHVTVDVETITKYAMYHDSLELLRGDILSITKDTIPGLREYTDAEEEYFLTSIVKFKLNTVEQHIIKLADLMACYKFIEFELEYPSNDYAKQAYIQTKKKYDACWNEFCKLIDIPVKVDTNQYPVFVKGYEADAGVDIILQEDATFMPMSTVNYNLHIHYTPKEGQMAFLCARTSAAAKGLTVATCPIDPNYTGDVMAIVHNISNDIIEYKRGEAFCQLVVVDIETIKQGVKVKKPGKRTTSNLGGTDRC